MTPSRPPETELARAFREGGDPLACGEAVAFAIRYRRHSHDPPFVPEGASLPLLF